jgi:hypothetical protein
MPIKIPCTPTAVAPVIINSDGSIGIQISTLLPALFANVTCAEFKAALSRCGVPVV